MGRKEQKPFDEIKLSLFNSKKKEIPLKQSAYGSL